jgi:hypothetical protein
MCFDSHEDHHDLDREEYGTFWWFIAFCGLVMLTICLLSVE